MPDLSDREAALRTALLDGAAWEIGTASVLEYVAGNSEDLVCAAGPKNKFQKRQGAKTVRLIEKQTGAHEKLSPDGATNVRALAARANYLAQDRPDLAYSAKELCR